MRLRSLSAALAAALLAAPAAAAQSEGDAARGEAAYAEACAACHDSVARLARRLPKTDQAAASLDAFLAGHHAPVPDTRADIIAFLLKE